VVVEGCLVGYGPCYAILPFHSGVSCFEVCGVVSDEAVGLEAFCMLTSQVPCYLGLLVPPWGLPTSNNPLTSHLDGEEGVGHGCVSL